MSRLEDLIQTLCPDGVGYQKLGDICQIATGKLNVNKQSDNGKYPFFTCAKEVYRIDTFAFDTEALLISGNGNVGYIHYYNGKFNAYQRTYVLSNFSINIFFVKHVLEWGLKKRIAEGLRLGSVPYIRLETLRDFFIPLPPLPVQEEIVRILDTFSGVVTELEQKLEAEQAARVRQYEHYRDQLLTSTQWKIAQFGNVAKIVRGASPRPINQFITNDSNGVNWIKIGDVNINSKYITSTKEKITPDGAQKSRYVQPGDFVLSNSMSFGRPYIMKTDGCIHDGWLSISEFEDTYSADFLYYLLSSRSVQSEFSQKASSGTVQNLNSEIVKSIYLPLPSHNVQEKIVSILDRFDTLVNDLKSGLPAEIALRRKQYEYYRDKLLTFPAKQPPL